MTEPQEYGTAAEFDDDAGPAVIGVISAADLGAMRFPPVRWIVPGVLAEGCSILAGRPKLGKSWLALDVALAVARGAYCLGDRHCEQGEVLYLALEDNRRRLQSRIEKVSPPHCADPWPQRLHLATEWPRADAGGIEKIEAWVKGRNSPRLVVVDVLAAFRASRGNSETHYESDYHALKGLQEIAGRHRIAVLVVHHVRKSQGETDPFERISGTLGLTGAADAALILDRTGQGCTLYCRGRDVPEFELAVSFATETCRWTIQGEAAEVHRTDERQTILAALAEAGEPLSPLDISDVTEMPRGNVRRMLGKMVRAGEVAREGRGRYKCYP